MHQINSNTTPTIFLNKFRKPTHNYPRNFARTNYSRPPFKLNKSKYQFQSEVQPCGKIFQPIQKKPQQQKTKIFKTVMKNRLIALENELTYF